MSSSAETRSSSHGTATTGAARPHAPAAPGGAHRRDGPRRGGSRHRIPFWLEAPLLLLGAVALLVLVQGFLVRIYVIPSGSMETTLHGCPGCTDDRVAVDKISYRVTQPATGDIVVFRGPPAWADNDEVSPSHPANPLLRGLLDASSYASLSSPDEKDFVKRVIAVGGQTVACCDQHNHVTVDGKALPEPYLHYQPGPPPVQVPFAPVHLGPGQLWVMGDNRNNSADSRAHGPITTADLIGKVRFIVLPLDRWGGV